MAGPLAVMAYVTKQDKNDLLVCTSEDGVNWSFAKMIGETARYAPTLAVLGDHLVLVFVEDGSNALTYRVSTDVANWSSTYEVAWFYDPADLYYPSDVGQGWLAGRVAGESYTAPSLITYHTQSDSQLYLLYVATTGRYRTKGEVWYSTAKMRGRPHVDGPVAFDSSFPIQIWTRDPSGDLPNLRRPGDLANLKTDRRPAVAVVNGTFVMVYNHQSSLRYSTSTDGKLWTYPQVIVDKGVDPAMAVLDDTAVVAWRYDDGSNRLGVAPIKDVGKPDKKPSVGEFANIAELTNYGPALTNLGNKLVLAFVAASERNHLLVCTSTDGVNWSPNRYFGHGSKMAPALTTFYTKSS